MEQKTIKISILLGVFSLLSIMIIQLIWISKTVALQERNIVIQEKKDSLDLIRFSQRVHIALRNTLEKISTDISDSSDLYGAVKQITTNYYSVDINEELHPFYLEGLLKREFYAQSIKQNFQYGIYDCYTDSIVYGNLITFSKKTHYNTDTNQKSSETYKHLKWEKKDGHYFTVYFPMVHEDFSKIESEQFSMWWYLAFVIAFPIVFFTYSISTLLKQKRLSEIKNDFINNMTHELKTPISTIRLSSEMLIQGRVYEKEDVVRYASVIFKENKRLQNQVERVLNIAKLDKEKIQLDKEQIHLHYIIKTARETFEVNEQLNGVKIYTQLNATNDVITADALHIENLIYNLIDNAIKYCEKQPKIKIITTNNKKGICIEFIDNGIGIKNEDVKLIFDKFYRVSTGNRHDVKGFGLGLYYVKTVVEAHKGTIEAKSSIGKGTSFKIYFPY